MSRHFLMVGFGTKYTYIKSALAAGDRVSLLITESKLKPNQEQFFHTVIKVKNMYDWAEVLPVVEQLHQRLPIDGVLTRFEPYLSVIGAINQHFALNGIDYATSRNFANKYVMKSRFISKQVACAAGISVDTLDQLDDFLASHSFPMILKKTTGTHSSYVLKVFSKEDLLEKRDFLKKKAKNYGIARPMSNYSGGIAEPTLILEELLTGRELTVDTFVSNNSFTHVGICEYVFAKDLAVDDSYLPIRTMPASITASASELILRTVEQALRALGAKNCVCHTEVFYDENKHTCTVVESTARGGGNRSEMTRLSSGYDYDGAVFRACMGQLVSPPTPSTKAVSVVEYFADKKGVLAAIDLDFLRQHPQVSKIKVRYKVGAVVDQARMGGKSLVRFYVTAANQQMSQALACTLFMQLKTKLLVNSL